MRPYPHLAAVLRVGPDGALATLPNRHADGSAAANTAVWTHTLADGTAPASGGCAGFTGLTGSAYAGVSNGGGSAWTEYVSMSTCASNTLPWFCFEQPWP